MTSIEPSYARAGLVVRWAVLAFALFLIGTNSFIIAGVLPEIAHDLRTPTTDIGYTITVYSILVAVLSPAIAVLLPRLSRTTLMVAGLAAFGVGVLVAALAPDFEIFTAGRIIASIGGAAVVPTATAAGAAITPPERRGQAIAVVGIGFTVASAVGAPLGTAIASISSWRVSMLGVAGLTVLVGIALAFVVRRVPVGQPIPLARRFAVLRDGRVVLPLFATLTIAAGFNLVFIFSSAVTGQTGVTLAVLLFIYGVFGIVGNTFAGPLTDRFGSRIVGIATMVFAILALSAIAIIGHDVIGLAIAFVFWGVSTFASTVPVQHRLLAVDPRTASVAISWYSTALYAGIAIAPLVGAVALSTGEARLLPVGGAVVTAIGLAAFVVGYLLRRNRPQTAAQETLAVETAERS